LIIENLELLRFEGLQRNRSRGGGGGGVEYLCYEPNKL